MINMENRTFVLTIMFVSLTIVACGQSKSEENLSGQTPDQTPQKMCQYIETIENMQWPPTDENSTPYIYPQTSVYKCTTGNNVCTEYRHKQGWGSRVLEDCES